MGYCIRLAISPLELILGVQVESIRRLTEINEMSFHVSSTRQNAGLASLPAVLLPALIISFGNVLHVARTFFATLAE